MTFLIKGYIVEVNFEKLKPKVDKISDKYSWNLYQFIKKYRGRVEVFKRGSSLYISPENYQCSCCPTKLNAARIMSVRCGNPKIFCYTSKKYRKITKSFFTKYLKEGLFYLDQEEKK